MICRPSRPPLLLMMAAQPLTTLMFFWNSPGSTAVSTSAMTPIRMVVAVIPISLAGPAPPPPVVTELELPVAPVAPVVAVVAVVVPVVAAVVDDDLLDDPHAPSTNTPRSTIPSSRRRLLRPGSVWPAGQDLSAL